MPKTKCFTHLLVIIISDREAGHFLVIWDHAAIDSIESLTKVVRTLVGCFLIFLLVSLWLGCIPNMSFLGWLEVPQKFVWVVESEFSD